MKVGYRAKRLNASNPPNAAVVEKAAASSLVKSWASLSYRSCWVR